jgi:hypothetical protein
MGIHDEIAPMVSEVAALSGSTVLVASNNGLISGILNSLMMILVTEIGDRTFFIAAILAMRNSRLAVFAGAMGNEI